MDSKQIEIEGMKELLKENELEIGRLRKEIKNLKEERDFFKEQATLWRNDYKNEYEKNKKLNVIIENNNSEQKADWEHIEELEEENKTLKNENVRLVKNLAEYKNEITDLKEENKKLKAELEFYKKQYEHTMGEDYIDEDLYDLDC